VLSVPLCILLTSVWFTVVASAHTHAPYLTAHCKLLAGVSQALLQLPSLSTAPCSHLVSAELHVSPCCVTCHPHCALAVMRYKPPTLCADCHLQRLRECRAVLRSRSSAFDIAAAALCILLALPFAFLLCDAGGSCSMVDVFAVLLCCRSRAAAAASTFLAVLTR